MPLARRAELALWLAVSEELQRHTLDAAPDLNAAFEKLPPEETQFQTAVSILRDAFAIVRITYRLAGL